MTKESTTCGYQEQLPGSSSGSGKVIFSNLTINKNDYTNTHLISDGVFRAPVDGTFKATYAVGKVDLQTGNGEHIFKLKVNDEELVESVASAKVTAYKSFIPMSGTVLLDLVEGDEVALFHEGNNNPKDAYHITLCYSLVQAKVAPI